MELNAIAKAYARRIERGDIGIEDVPENIRAMVETIITD